MMEISKEFESAVNNALIAYNSISKKLDELADSLYRIRIGTNVPSDNVEIKILELEAYVKIAEEKLNILRYEYGSIKQV